MTEKILAGNLDIDLDAYRLLRDGKSVRLTRTEWALLAELVKHRNQVLSHRTLLQRVWGTEYGDESDYVHTYISRLRRKLEDNPTDPQFILTEPGIGYLFQREVSKPVVSTPTASPLDTPRSTTRVINPLPLVVGAHYVGRAREQAELVRLMHERTPLISVYGRTGVGKTALVCKVLSEVAGQGDYAGIVQLSANSTGISLQRILTDFNRLLELSDLPPDKSSPEPQITALLERLSAGNFILLLDNLETYQDLVTGTLTSKELELFLTMALQQGGALRIVVTSREPLSLPRYLKIRERSLVLHDGLSLEESVDLLRKCDPDNTAGLRDAKPAALERIAALTNGYPRALEAVVGLLLEDPFLNVEALLRDTTRLEGEMNIILVHQALERLEPDYLRVMQVVAAFERPLTQQLVAEIAAPFVNTPHLHDILNRLVRAFFLKYDPTTAMLTAHPIDVDYARQRIPVEAADGFTRRALHQRIAAYHHVRQNPNAPLQTLDDLEPYQSEFWQLVYAGDMSEATELLLRLDEAVMTRFGQYDELSRMYGSVAAPLPADHPQLWRVSLRLGDALRGIGKANEAIDAYQRALSQAQGADADVIRGMALNSLGWAYYDQGKYDQALQDWQQAANLFARVNDQSGTATAYGGLGWVSYLLGQYAEAENYFRQALAIFEQRHDERGVAINLGDRGVVAMAQADFPRAIDLLDRSMEIADRNQYVSEQSYKGSYLAIAYLLSGELTHARDTANVISAYTDIAVNLPTVLAVQGVILTRLGETDAAQDAFNAALQRAEDILGLTNGLYNVLFAKALAGAGLALLNGYELAAVQQHYDHALTICDKAGVVQMQSRLLEALMQSENGEKLNSVKTLLVV